MDEYWKALINGLTPDKPKQVHLWWKVPLIVISLMYIFTVILTKCVA